MIKQLLLPFLFIILLSSACTPDGDVDMPIPEKSVEDQIKGIWLGNMHISREYDYAPDDTLGVLLEETIRMSDTIYPEDYYLFDGSTMQRQNYGNVDYIMFNRAGKNYIKYHYEYEDFPGIFEITHISDKKMIWQKVIRTDKSYDDNTWRKTVITTEFVKQ